MEADVRGKSVAILGAGPSGIDGGISLPRFWRTTHLYYRSCRYRPAFFPCHRIWCRRLLRCRQRLAGTLSCSRKPRIRLERRRRRPGDVRFASAYKMLFASCATAAPSCCSVSPASLWPISISPTSLSGKASPVKGIFGRKMFETWETCCVCSNRHLNLQAKLDKILPAKPIAR